MQQKIMQIIFDLEIIACELIALVIPFTAKEYLSSAVNMLINSLKISDSIKTKWCTFRVIKKYEKNTFLHI